MPWKWPTFDELYAKHGCYTCRERFPLPNLKSLITKNKKQVFRVSNGLGGELERLGEAKSFMTYAEWTEKMNL